MRKVCPWRFELLIGSYDKQVIGLNITIYQVHFNGEQSFLAHPNQRHHGTVKFVSIICDVAVSGTPLTIGLASSVLTTIFLFLFFLCGLVVQVEYTVPKV